MESPGDYYVKQHEFIEKVSHDPMWLLTCLTCTDKNLNPNNVLTYAVWVYAGILGCHHATKMPERCTEKMIQWLQEMQEAGEPVVFTDIPENIFYMGVDVVTREWHKYYYWLQFGVYNVSELALSMCDLPALVELERALRARRLEVKRATA
jgi:hypothetical protein